MTALHQKFVVMNVLGQITHKALGGSVLVSGSVAPALRINTSSDPPVALNTSVAA